MGNDEAPKKEEVILQAGGAGILVTLLGVRLENGKWKFLLDNDEGTLADFLPEEDSDLLPKLRTKSEWVDSWDKAVALLNRYPWTCFVPKQVHPEFRKLVLSAVHSRNPTRAFELKRSLSRGWEHHIHFDAAKQD